MNVLTLYTHTQYSSTDAGYAVTDKFLRRALQRPECQWVSVTTSDNAYGSEVVQRVLSYRAGASMLAAPLDSKRNFDRCKSHYLHFLLFLFSYVAFHALFYFITFQYN